MNTQQQARIDTGCQCPECFGVRVDFRPRRQFEAQRYMCEECGAQWSDSRKR
jgi:transposase-like protein